jgi:hypothetical protein
MEMLRRAGLYEFVSDRVMHEFVAMHNGRSEAVSRNPVDFWRFVVGGLSMGGLSALMSTIGESQTELSNVHK